MAKINTSEQIPGGVTPGGVTPGDTANLGRELSMAMIAFQEAVARRLGMTMAERKTLGILNELGTTTPGVLAQATGLTTGAITGIVDRLERAGYARRVPHPRDRRSVMVEICRSEELQATMLPLFAPLSAAMGELGTRFSPEALASIHAYLDGAVAILKAETERLRGGPTAPGPHPG